MGKRKYNSEKQQPSKKSKLDNSSQIIENESESSEQTVKATVDENEKKTPSVHHDFNIKHFRKELAAKQGQTMALTQFLQICLKPDNKVDYLLEYLKVGGNSHEILRQITQENKKNLTLSTPVFHIFHLIILKVQSSVPHMIPVTEEACRYFLNTFMTTAEIMISENSGPRHRKIILKLLTSMVTLNPDLGIEVLNQAPLTPKHLKYIIEKSSYKDKDNVRTAFVNLMTSFLVDGHLPLVKALLEKQGLLPLVIPGLIHDEAETVLMFLNILKSNVVHNPFISKSLKLKTFSHQVLHNMFKLFSWKGPPELTNETRNESRPDIMSLLSNIIMTLFTSHRIGLYFTDKSLGTADAYKNQNLYKALLTLKRPWENDYECDTLLQIVYNCPDLHRAVIHIIEQSFEPQHSPIWERTIEFTIKLLDKMRPEDMIPRMNQLNSSQVANFIRFLTLPVPLLKYIQVHTGKDHTISLYCIKVLVKMLQTLSRFIHIIEMNDFNCEVADLKIKLEYFVPKHFPVPSIIVALIQEIVKGEGNAEFSKEYTLQKPNDADSLILLVDLLLAYNDIHPSLFETLEGNLDMKKLLEFSATLTDGHIALLKFKIVSLWIILDSTAITVKNHMFKDLFLIMLEVYTSDDDKTWIEAKDTLYNFFKNTSIFETDEDEIHVILYTLRHYKIKPSTFIGDVIEYVLINKIKLTEYIRNQMVHFEISDEATEASLDKLFNDLMENRNTENCMFLENKLPSPFIMGCVQFIQNNKEAKKRLKGFMSLYLANLLHCNYSPELTEVFMEDSKLDIRSYISSWISQPVVLPDIIVSNDPVLKSMSMSIIDNADIPLTEIFDCLNTTDDESDIVINNVAYTVDATNELDASQLLIWAKYLIFCTVRLTNMDLLDEKRIKTLADFYQCIVVIAKKHHLINICRTIVLILFKNPHFLKLYRLLDTGKAKSNILATNFLLKFAQEHEDIVNYLDKKHKLLKSYQQKNYNEIVKAFVKINKRKNVNGDHLIDVLKIIGLTKEDDLLVFKQIFAVEQDVCFKDDKEPSIVLELLRILIEKYSQSITLELPQGIIRKTMKLYTDLIYNKDITPNLIKLENSLIDFFEKKSHHCAIATEDIFIKFFITNMNRKSTAHLASVLLKYNKKLCNVFKSQITRAEILSQRELTLPLGTAVIEHSQFLIQNKEFLTTIYNEYKSNICKVLEKPHKAGQIYVTCWRFIRKLILECMDLQDCQKMYAKPYKFEAVHLSHINLMQAVFLKLNISSEDFKIEHIFNYYATMIHLASIAIKENKDTDVVKELFLNIYHVTEICKAILMNTQESEFQKITESPPWHNFCKVVLKASLRLKTADQENTMGPKALYLLSNLIKLFYKTEHEDIVTLFDMVTSHSEFLNVMLSHHSSHIKSSLLDFIFVLITKNKSVMKSQQIPVYLSAYHATRSPCDRIILSILHYYETTGLPVNEYKPYVWGDSAANHYAVRKNRTSSLWAHPTPNQVLSLFEKDIIDRTVRKFPVTQKLDYMYELPSNIDMNSVEKDFDGSVKSVVQAMHRDGILKTHPCKDTEAAINTATIKASYEKVITLLDIDSVNVSHMQVDASIYDPVFLFSLLSHLLAPGSVASCFKLLRSGLLSVPVVALSSHCPKMRAAAYHVLHRFSMLLETETRHKNDKLLLTDFINTLQHSLSTGLIENGDNNNLKSPRLPAISALYLAKALMVSTAPFDPLYKPVNNFFIAKEFIDVTVVPDFLSLFHDADVEAVERRLWILDVIKDGTKTMTDVNVIFKTMCLKMIMDFGSTVICERKVQEKILSVINAVASVPRAFEILLEGYGLISWLHHIVRRLDKDGKFILKHVICLLESMIHSMYINSLAKYFNNVTKNGKNVLYSGVKVNKDIEHEILMILYILLRHVDDAAADDVASYIKIYRLLSKRTIKLLSKKEILNIVNKCGASNNDSECMKLLTKAIVKSDGSLLKSKNLETEDCLLRELTLVVKIYIID